MAKRWYGVHTYSGFENKVRLSLLERIKNFKLEDDFGDVLIPSETVVELKKGEKRTSSRKFFPEPRSQGRRSSLRWVKPSGSPTARSSIFPVWLKM